jgi:GNAT superfamily N-acetyltransferase
LNNKFPKIISLLCAIAITLSLGGCSSTLPSIEADPIVTQLRQDIGDYAVPFTLHVDPTYQGAGYAELETNKVFISAALLREYRSGKYNYNHLLHIVAHECGHLSKTGKDLALSNDRGSERFADFYGLLLLEEMQHDGFPVDLYDAINRFLIRNGKDIPGGIHGDDIQRYRALKEKLDYWARNSGREPD